MPKRKNVDSRYVCDCEQYCRGISTPVSAADWKKHKPSRIEPMLNALRGVVGEVLGRGGDHLGSGSQAGGEKKRSANEPSGGQNVAGSSSLAHSHNNLSRDSEAGHNPVRIRPWPTLEAPNMPYNVSRISQTPQHIAYHTHTTPLPPSLAGASQGYSIGMHHATWTPYSMAPSLQMELSYRLQRIELEFINLRQNHANMAAELADLRRRSGFGPSAKIDNFVDTESSGPAARLLLQTKRPKNINTAAVVPSKRGHEEDGVTVMPSKKSKDGSSPGSLAPPLQDKGKGRAVSSLADLIEDNSPKPPPIKEEEPGAKAKDKTSGSAGPDGQNAEISVIPGPGAPASTPAAPSTASEPAVLSSGPAPAPSMPAATEPKVGKPKRRPRRKIDQWPPSEDTEGAQWAYAREWYAQTLGTQGDFKKHYSEIPEKQKNKLRRLYNSKAAPLQKNSREHSDRDW